MRGRSVMRSSGPFSKSLTSVSFGCSLNPSCTGHLANPYNWPVGSRYIYDLYYEKEAISKQLYDWLLKNNYADANLIAKWKKQGYEKVRRPSEGVDFAIAHSWDSIAVLS